MQNNTRNNTSEPQTHIEVKPERTEQRRFCLKGCLTTALAAAGSLLSGCVAQSGSTERSAAGDRQYKNILILTGSARDPSNSDMLADAFAKGAREAGHTVNIFQAGKKRMTGCLACDACWTTGKPCVQEDSFDQLWPLLEQADMLVLCSPLYWYSFSGHIKNALDRIYCYGKKNRLRSLKIKESMLIMCGATWLNKSFDGAAESWRQSMGYNGWRDRGRLYATRLSDGGDVAGRRILSIAERMGREL